MWLLCLDGPTLIHRHTVLSRPELAGLDAISSLATSRQRARSAARRYRQTVRGEVAGLQCNCVTTSEMSTLDIVNRCVSAVPIPWGLAGK
jgi:hypothetical protein